MPKYYACGYNGNGVLGLGDNANKTYFTEKDLLSLRVVKMGSYTRTYDGYGIKYMYPLNIMLLSDGHIYISGCPNETPASNNKTLTKIFDADRLVDIYVEDGSEASNKVVWGITSTTIYRIVISFDTSTQTYQETHTIIDDSVYQWSAVYPKRLICGSAISKTVYIATDNSIYIMNSKTHEFSKVMQLIANYMIAIPVGQNPGSGNTLYVIDENATLWGYGNNDAGQIIPGGNASITEPYRMYDGVKSVAGNQRKVAFVDIDGGVHMWGKYANKYDIRGTGSTNDLITDTSAFTTGFKNVWMVGFCTSTNNNEYMYTVYLQKEDGTIWVNGQNKYGNCGIGTTTDVNGIVKTSNTIYGNVDLGGICNIAVFIYEKDLSIFCYVYSSDGSQLLVALNNLNGVKNLLIGGVLPATFRVTDYNGNQFNDSIQYSTPRKFLGLAYTPNSSESIFVAGNEYTVNFNADTNLYMVLGDAVLDKGFEIRAYKYHGEHNRVRKDEAGDVDGHYKYLTEYATFAGNLREECSLTKPVITFQMSVVPQFNYVYIPEFYRWYYVDDIEAVNKNLWRMYLSCDVLCSFQDEIYSLTSVVITRTEDIGIQNGNLDDPYLRTEAQVEKTIITDASTPQYFGLDLRSVSRCFLLDTIGAEVST